MTELWSYAAKRQRSAGRDASGGSRPKGRVLRVKDGYNPNSSSIGSTIPAFLAIAAAAGGLTVLLLNLLDVAGNLLRKQQHAGPPPAEPPSSDADEREAEAEPEDD